VDIRISLSLLDEPLDGSNSFQATSHGVGRDVQVLQPCTAFFIVVSKVRAII
jgi:hypothetical protein